MEVKLDPGQIPNMKEFVNHLTQTMHSSVPGSLVIWWVLGDIIFSVTYIFPVYLIMYKLVVYGLYLVTQVW